LQRNHNTCLAEACLPPVVVPSIVDQVAGHGKLNSRSLVVWISVCLLAGFGLAVVALSALSPKEPTVSTAQLSPRSSSSTTHHFEPQQPTSTDYDKRAKDFLRAHLARFDRFKDHPQFKMLGFSARGPYNAWLTELKTQEEYFGSEATGGHVMYGFGYLQNLGMESVARQPRRKIINDMRILVEISIEARSLEDYLRLDIERIK
jgi:hypothetical protein